MNRQSLRKAQGMTEYIIIVILVALAVIAAVNTFSGAVDSKYTDAKGDMIQKVRTN